LSSDKDKFDKKVKSSFVKNFYLEFEPDFEKQFYELIKRIKKEYGTKKGEDAIKCHAILNFGLQKIATQKIAKNREVDKKVLDKIIEEAEYFFGGYGYYKYLKKEKYLNYLKKEYFTPKKLNMPKNERLFIIEIDDKIGLSKIIEIIKNIGDKYFNIDHSPAPYVCLHKIKEVDLVSIKRLMCDKKIKFTDGTYFGGDRFRLDVLVSDTNLYNKEIPIKLVNEEYLNELIRNKNFDEIFSFYVNFPIEINNKGVCSIDLFIEQTQGLLKVIK